MVADDRLVVDPSTGLLVAPDDLESLSDPQDESDSTSVASTRGTQHPPTVSDSVEPSKAELGSKIKELENERQVHENELDLERTWHAKTTTGSRREN